MFILIFVFMNYDLQLLTSSDFSPYLNEKLFIRFADDKKQCAELIQIAEGAAYFDLERKSFSFVVRTSEKNSYHNQAVFILEHPVKGDLPVFFVPIGPDAVGMKYEAVFS